MASFFRYGSVARPTGECDVKINITTRFNDAMQELSRVHRWTVDGLLLGKDSADVQAKANVIINAFKSHGKDASWFNHTLPSSGAIGGVRVVSVDFPDGGAAELATKRTYRVVLEAEYPVSGAPSRLVSFEEHLEFSGGGPVYGFLQPIKGDPIEQRLRDRSVYEVFQVGSAVGYGDWPKLESVTKLIWPGRVQEAPRETRGSPKRVGERGQVSYVEYPISWRIRYASSVQLLGNPHRWPSHL